MMWVLIRRKHNIVCFCDRKTTRCSRRRWEFG
nr:MAG TPA: hypothetical protein [Caudoviricetes sp.]